MCVESTCNDVNDEWAFWPTSTEIRCVEATCNVNDEWAFWPATEIRCVESTFHVKDDWAFWPRY